MPESAPDEATTLPHSARVVIVGAGQAGLSVAYHLQRRGLTPGSDLVIVDRGPTTGGAWQFRWESLRLGTAHRVSDLPGLHDLGLSFETADQTRAARDVVAEYYELYEQHFGLQVFRPVDVTAVRERMPGGDLLVSATRGSTGTGTRTGTGTGIEIISAEVVVNASGTWATPFRPFYKGGETFRGLQISTPEYRSAHDFAGKRVIVVGGGTSAVGFLLELEGVAASTFWVTRRPVEFGEPGAQARASTFADGAGSGSSSVLAVPPADAQAAVGLESRLAAVAQQDEAAKAGRVLPSIISGTGLPATPKNLAGVERGLLVAHPMFTSIEHGGVRFADGSFEPADAIIWATGFRADLAHLAPLKLREQAGGIRVEQGRAGRNGRVFLAGYGPQASTIGANRAGRLVAVQVLDALQQIEHPEPV
ncbi:FAD-dependent oxidoreductase [Subtercola endophyticus]|uniref:FAD-dependent oxidoreductase n=1 Tax=Subtercola endophyticus TaxID=2895559 RepID=UPI001E4346C2|nr:FAD-dependent oxidoreductase [Subtercola endophyticus]UFS59299.1 NAD(P)/FAD-dependent oxidoreductase [Subtercola endophyticus]